MIKSASISVQCKRRYRPERIRIEEIKRNLFGTFRDENFNLDESPKHDFEDEDEFETFEGGSSFNEPIHFILSIKPNIGRIWRLAENTIRCDMMDPITKLSRSGKPLDPVPGSCWSKIVTCGEGANKRMARISGPMKNYIFGEPATGASENDNEFSRCFDDTITDLQSDSSSAASPEFSPEIMELPTTDEDSTHSPNKSTSETEDASKSGVELNTTHVGEQTPHTSGKGDIKMKRRSEVSDAIENEVATRAAREGTPQTLQLRGIPMPEISWTDNVDLSLRLVYKEEIGLTERNHNVFRRNPNLNTRMRAILFDWLMEVCDVYKLRRVTYYLTIDYIDRYLSRVEVVPKNHLQLLGISCLFIASKYEEIYPPKVTELAYVTDGACTDSDMLSKELEVLSLLRWDVGPATVSSWLAFFLQLATTKGKALRDLVYKMERNDDIIYPQYSPHLFMTGSMILDLCSLDDGMLQFKYSQIAAAVVYFTLNRETALLVSGYTWQNIKLCVEWMEPFALVVFKNLGTKPIVAPREYVRSGSALRCVNPNIVLEEGHCIQNHIIDLAMLEEVYNEVKIMRENFKSEQIMDATGWTASEEGFDPTAIQALAERRKSRHKNSYNPSSSDALDSSSESECEQRQTTINVDISSSVSNTAVFENKVVSQSEDTSSPKLDCTENSQDRNSTVYNLACASDPYDYDGDDSKDVDKHGKSRETNRDRSTPNSFSSGENTNNDDNLPINEQRGIKRRRNDDDGDGDADGDDDDDDDVDDNGDEDGDDDGDDDVKEDDDDDNEDNEVDDAEEKTSTSIEADIHPSKKFHCDAGPCCNKTLSSPACSKLYLKEGEFASFELKPNNPTPSIVAPNPRQPPLPTEDEYERQIVRGYIVPQITNYEYQTFDGINVKITPECFTVSRTSK